MEDAPAGRLYVSAETTNVSEQRTSELDTSRIVTVSQIVGGEATCYCGAPAVFVVTTTPDDDPGPTCTGHAFEYMDFVLDFARQLWGSKVSK